MKKIKLVLKYQDYPLWTYDVEGELINFDYPIDIDNKNDIKLRLENIQKEYNNLFLDDGKEFKYIGFKNKSDEINFFQEINNIYNELIILTEGKY